MDVVFGDRTSDDLGLVLARYLTDEVSGSDGYVSDEYRIPILGDPDDMVGTVKCGMGCFAIVLHASIVSC